MSFQSLSTELIEKIASYLDAQDIAALKLCCRRSYRIVKGSLLLHYLYQAGLAGVCDPLWDLPTLSILDRLEMLERWEASWNNIGKHIATPRLVIPADRDLFGPFFLCDDYLFAVDWQGDSDIQRHPALLYVDLRDALRTGRHTWKQIDYPPGSIAITQAFSVEEDDLVVSVLR
jgi:F-box domain